MIDFRCVELSPVIEKNPYDIFMVFLIGFTFTLKHLVLFLPF